MAPWPMTFQLLVWSRCKHLNPRKDPGLEISLLEVCTPKGLKQLSVLYHKGPFFCIKENGAVPHL